MARSENKQDRLQLPTPQAAASEAVRLGSGIITAEFPPLKPAKVDVSGGAVRLGSGIITADFPVSR